MRERGNLHALGKRDIGDIAQFVEFEVSDIDVEVLRQILRQAHDFDVGHQVRNLAAALLHADRDVLVQEVDRHVHADDLVLNDALQVHVQDLAPGGMALQVFQDHSLALLTDLDVENARIKRLVLELLENLVVVECEGAWRAAGTVKDCGNLSFTTQAAARTFPHVVPEFRNQIKIVSHD